MKISLKDIPNITYLDRNLIQSLTNGFVEIFGEEKRLFFESIQNDMFKEGYNAGENYYNLKVLKEIKREIKSSLRNLEYRKNEKCTLPEISEDDLKKQFESLYDIDVVKILIGKNIDIPHFTQLYKNIDKYKNLISKNIGTGSYNNVPKIYNKNPGNFNIFKKHKIHEKDTINMYSECGLGLDEWCSENIDFYIEDHEFFYMLESIPMKYYLLGVFVSKQDLKEKCINKAIEFLNPEVDQELFYSWKDYFDILSYSFEENILINLVRDLYTKKYNEDIKLKIQTSGEISEDLNNFENLFNV